MMGMLEVLGAVSEMRRRKTEKESMTVISSETLSPLSEGRKRATQPRRESAKHGIMTFTK